MNKVAKILSAVISVTVALSMALVMLTSALAAQTTTFALNVVSENDDQIVVSVDLVDGGFQSIDFEVKYNAEKIEKCSSAVASTDAFTLFVNAATCKASGMYLDKVDYDKLFDVKGAVATFTFDKVDGAEIGPDDITVEFEVCGTVADQFEVVINNNIPEIEVPSEPSEEPSEPSEEPSEPSEEPSEPSEEPSEPSEEPSEPSEEPSEPSEEPSEPSEEPSEPSEDPSEPSEDPSEPSEEPSKPSEDKTDAPAEDKTDAPVADGDVVNPDTGDSVTASAAIISLLAVSGAAIVALRKKED
ncbi:MAG: LPXTG cell wall anchor domain-containing protein [Clostridia bacterium]|nr:LPXTG cell wall anchor domain-containing protein [Clostridia bacterium]